MTAKRNKIFFPTLFFLVALAGTVSFGGRVFADVPMFSSPGSNDGSDGYTQQGSTATQTMDDGSTLTASTATPGLDGDMAGISAQSDVSYSSTEASGDTSFSSDFGSDTSGGGDDDW